MNGIEKLEKDLQEKGYTTSKPANNFVSFFFKIPHGRFRGQEIEIALQAPHFPEVPPPGIYVKPFLLPINTTDKTHPLGGIHDSKLPTAEYQYWSRPFKGWSTTDKNIDTYFAFIRTLFDFE